MSRSAVNSLGRVARDKGRGIREISMARIDEITELTVESRDRPDYAEMIRKEGGARSEETQSIGCSIV